MLVGLMGHTDLYDMRRESIAQAFSKHVFYFDDLTLEFMRNMPVTYQGKSYADLLKEGDRAAILTLKQKVWDGIRAIRPSLYTDWMSLQLARTVFSKGLKTSTKVTEAVIGDLRSEDQLRWFQKFGIDRHNRWNKAVLVKGDPLPSPLGDHPSENFIEGYDQVIDLSLPVQKETDRLKRQFYVE